MKKLSFLAPLAATLSLLTTDLLAQTTIDFNHLDQSPGTVFRTELKHGDILQIKISQTFPDAFDYRVEGFAPVVVTPSGPSATSSLTPAQLKDIPLPPVTHNREYGGYYVRIRSKVAQLPTVNVNGTTRTLQETTLTIIVDTQGWNYDIAGAFAITKLTDPVFAVVTESDGAGGTQQRIVQDPSAEDDASLGLAGMVHLYHQNKPNLALSFGLGINDGDATSYFFGPSWRFNDKAAITVGWVWGPRKRLPAGVRVGDVVTDPNILNNLANRTDRQTFISFSYSFLNPGDTLTKPFAGGGSGTPAVAVPPAPAAAPAPAPQPQAIDTDEDGIQDEDDNCPRVPNPDQANRGGTAAGDACEP